MTQPDHFSWRRLIQQAEGLLGVTSNRISNAANLCAFLYQELSDISWVGFYFPEDESLMLGPFQGKPACVRIDMGKGACGTAAVSGQIVRIADVETFDGHIACDAAARSEIVLPLIKSDELIGVLDIDSVSLDRFSPEDEIALAEIARVYLASID